MKSSVIVKSYNNATRIKPMSHYLSGKDIHNKIEKHACWQKELSMFNAYKHHYTNYDRIMFRVFSADFTLEESNDKILAIYRQLIKQVDEKYKEACIISYKSCLNKLKRHNRSIERSKLGKTNEQ